MRATARTELTVDTAPHPRRPQDHALFKLASFFAPHPDAGQRLGEGSCALHSSSKHFMIAYWMALERLRLLDFMNSSSC
jgi:hypothetical protein